MAKQDIQALLGSKRAELAEVKRAATAEKQAAIAARSELATVTDEKAAITAVARERVASNKARVLGDQAAELEAEISALEQQAKEERAAILAADADTKRSAAVAALWEAFATVQAAADAERAALEAKATASGDPWVLHSGTIGDTAGKVGAALEGLGVAKLDVYTDGRRVWRKA